MKDVKYAKGDKVLERAWDGGEWREATIVRLLLWRSPGPLYLVRCKEGFEAIRYASLLKPLVDQG